jgi:hypothetical protein
MKQISSALVKAQKAFNPALKQSVNPHFKSKYADLASCIEAVISALNDNGIYLLQKTYECETGITIQTIFIHESGESLEAGFLRFPVIKNDPQGYASALTYARRNSLMASCGIAPEDDDGNASVSKNEVDVIAITSALMDMKQSVTIADLHKNFAKAIALTNGDQTWKQKIISQKDELKAKL